MHEPDVLCVSGGAVKERARAVQPGRREVHRADGGVLPQTYVIRFDDINGNYKLATNETNNKPVTVVAGQEFTVTFNITKGVIPPPGP